MADEEIIEIMSDYDLSEGEAEEVQTIKQDLDIDIEDAIEIYEIL